MLNSAQTTATITLASLANNARATSTAIDNTVTAYDSLSVQFQLTTGATFTTGGKVVVALMGSEDNTNFQTQETQILSELTGMKATTAYQFNFDTTGIVLPRYFKFAVTNITGSAFNSTGGNYVLTFVGHKNVGVSIAQPAVAGDIAVPSAATAAVVTYTADAAHKHQIDGIVVSYAGGTPVGNLKVEDVAANVVFSVDISGIGQWYFPVKLVQNAINTALIITLGSGGSGVTGKLSVLGHSKV